MQIALSQLKSKYPKLKLVEGSMFSWSPREHTITYKSGELQGIQAWSLLHELAHASLGHHTYETDLELVLLEVEAWDKAKEIAANYDEIIDEEHIQDCIDTYRDWLYRRSSCPMCGNTSLQQNSVTYKCFNCATTWTVTASRFCRPYRLTKQQKTPPEVPKHPETTFL